jgi:hypothetical protein
MNNYLNCDNFAIAKTFLTINDLNKNMVDFNDNNERDNLKTLDEFNLFHLISLKKINYNNKIFGLIQIQMRYFLKKNNYDYIIKYADRKIDEALKISLNNNGQKKMFVLLDFSTMTQKNFSRKFLKLLSNKFNQNYDVCLAFCYLYGNQNFIKLTWPFISTLLEKTTKDKLVILKNN